MTLGATWTNARSMFRLGWDGSWFTNNNDTLVWDRHAFTAALTI